MSRKTERKMESRVNLAVSPELATRLDDYFHENRFRSLSDAVRDLLEYALKHKPEAAKLRGR